MEVGKLLMPHSLIEYRRAVEAAVSGLADLPYQLLFFVGRSRGQGPRVSALRRAFLLDTYLPLYNAARMSVIRIEPNNTITFVTATSVPWIVRDVSFKQLPYPEDACIRTSGQEHVRILLLRTRIPGTPRR